MRNSIKRGRKQAEHKQQKVKTFSYQQLHWIRKKGGKPLLIEGSRKPHGKTNREISARTAQAKIIFQRMKTILTNKHISIKTRKRALQRYIEPVLMYGCEAWNLKANSR
ncbi:hypothetical protein PoB_003494900 [Plakobranchus ocellatus]|uniref:Endonuclease-reverse transcriptase n=1 Tax=Plakobranchus ocellatus TaxID=259542 RepID=A0AAV4AQM3_9GAST|nr:hypothetical protein PoB_003494900 [Plakobranchus ocellatus]